MYSQATVTIHNIGKSSVHVIRRIKNGSLGSIERLNSLGKVSSSGCVSCTQHLELRKSSSREKRPMDTSSSLWTPNMAKCSEKHSQASKKLQSMSISWSMLQHYFKLLQNLTTNDFLKRWLRSAILHLTTCKPTETTKMLQLHEPTILYGLKQHFQCCQLFWLTNNFKCP